jgi:hypothetical protein
MTRLVRVLLSRWHREDLAAGSLVSGVRRKPPNVVAKPKLRRALRASVPALGSPDS